MDINYELYKVFYYVATTLSFSEASKQLYISQSAVSQAIKALEKRLEQTLFIRSTKRVQLTPEGELLLRHVEPAMNLIKRGEAQLVDNSSGAQIRIFLRNRHRFYPSAPPQKRYRRWYRSDRESRCSTRFLPKARRFLWQGCRAG